MTPPHLAIRFPSLPAILYVICQRPMPSCSKAPWGLSVQSRVTCIFTGISISPGPSLRQCPNRYAFRAGRNLPDKEFRYLRTVIVTAAGLFSAAAQSSNSICLHPRRPSFSRSYGCILPSSLTRVFPRTLGFSPRLPVSVLVRADDFSLEAFLGSLVRLNSVGP